MSSALPVDLDALVPFLRHLSDHGFGQAVVELDGWRAMRQEGGRNNLLYRVSGPVGELAAKFTIRDARDRAGREYNGLTALHAAGIDVAPRPVLLDRDSYRQPLVAQEWLAGEPLGEPPGTEDGWQKLADLLARCHSLRPGQEAVRLQPAVLNGHTVAEARQIVRDELAKMPASERPADVERMAERFERQAFRDWPEPGLTLVRCDPNIANVIRRPGSWACVDWEYSGWGDPAWDVAEIMLHPSYREVPEARWAWLCSRVLSDDVRGPERLAVYRRAMNVWWLARLSRLRYETLRGLDVRLVEPRAGWEAELEQNYEHYLRLAGRAV